MWLKRLLKIFGGLAATLVVLVLLTVGGVWLNALRITSQRHTNPVANVTVAGTPEQVARGAYLVTAFPGCVGCHAADPNANPPILNGKPFTGISALAAMDAPNLTPGGRLRDWSDGEIIRAIREGMDKDGYALMLMPAEEYRHLSDEDAQAIVAYLRSQPAVDNPSAPRRLTLLGTMLVGTTAFSLSNQPPVQNVTAPSRGPTIEYGEHLALVSGCRTCHGPRLDGVDVPQGPPPGPSLQIVKAWTEEQFVKTLREGVSPVGRRLSDEMPWREYGRGTDEDLRALYLYLRSLP